MTNKQQIWMERKAILKDGFLAALPGLVIFMVFIGVVVATGRIDRQWDEGVRSRRASVNDLAVSQLKDFAVIQTQQSEIDYLPEGIDADRFENDNEAFVAFVDEYFNWDGLDECQAKRAAAFERIGEYSGFWQKTFFRIFETSKRTKLEHKWTFNSTAIGIDAYLDADQTVPREVWQTATVQDIHAMEIMDDGQYMYLAIVPAHRYVGRKDKETYFQGLDMPLCLGVWYSCDENSVITPQNIQFFATEYLMK